MRHILNPRPRPTAIRALTVALLGAAGLVASPVASDTVRPADVSAERLVDDGLARTPPMGFNNWNSTHCSAEFNEAMVKGIADIFVEKGLKDAGYQYVNLDDCWALPSRDAEGRARTRPGPLPERASRRSPTTCTPRV